MHRTRYSWYFVTGKPDVDETRNGRRETPWYKKVYKHARPPPWMAERRK